MYGLIALSIIATKVLIARFYGQEELGQFSYFFGLVTVAFLFTSFGLPEAVTQLVVKNHQLLRPALKKAVSWIIFVSISVSLPLLLTSFFLNDTASKINFVFYILTYTFFYLIYCVFRAYKKFVSGTWYSLINRLVFIAIIIIFAFFSMSFDYVLGGLSIALLTATLISLPSFLKLWREEEVDRSVSKENVGTENIGKENVSKEVGAEIEKAETKKESKWTIPSKELLSVAFPLALMQAGFYLLRETDLLVIPYLADFTQLGLYSAHSSLSNIIRLIAYVFPVVILPLAAVSKYKIDQSFWRITKILVPFSLLVLAATYIFVPLLYGKEYTDYTLPIALVISSALMVIYSYFNSVFVGENGTSKKYLQIIVIDFLITLIMNTGLTLYFVKVWGIIGAPLATAFTVVIKIGLNVYGIRRMRDEAGKIMTAKSL